MENVKAEKLKYSGICQKYENSFREVKEIIVEFFKKIDMGRDLGMN